MRFLYATLRFTVIYIWEICHGGFRIAWDVLTPGLPTSPRIIDVEVPEMKPHQRLMLASLVSMTPGSITVDYNDRGDLLHIHLLYSQMSETHMREAIRDRYLPVVLSLSHRPTS
jgi:multicomponent Na+:H+ antiporter subunit E